MPEHNPDVVYGCMFFKTREEFKQHMAIYAIIKNSDSETAVQPLDAWYYDVLAKPAIGEYMQ